MKNVGVMLGWGVRVGKGLGVTETVQVGNGVRVGQGVEVISSAGVLVGAAVKDASISAMAVLISNVGGKDVVGRLLVSISAAIIITQRIPMANNPMIRIGRFFFMFHLPKVYRHFLNERGESRSYFTGKIQVSILKRSPGLIL